MKKFFRFFVFLLIIGVGVFVFLRGWAQFQVPNGSVGVLRSKTHGIDKDLIKEGNFRWVWYKLIPRNAVIMVFTPLTSAKTIHLSGVLPEGDLYQRFTATDADFSWALSVGYSFEINPNELPTLIEEKNLNNQEALDNFAAGTSAEIETYIRNAISRNVTGNGDVNFAENFERYIVSELQKHFNYLDNFDVNITVTKTPDLGLYTVVKDIYFSYLARQKDVLSVAAKNEADLHMVNQSEFEKYERFGELLTKYPVLLQAMPLIAEIGKD